MHISQARLAQSADISLSHLLDIEYCKSWVSDKTLAAALNMEVYQLFIPSECADEAMKDLLTRILKLYWH